MDIAEDGLHRSLIAFSDQTISESSSQISRFVESKGVETLPIDELIKQGDQVLIEELGGMLELSTSQRVFPETSNEELFDINEQMFNAVRNWESTLKTVFDVVLVKKILENFQYTGKNVNQNLIRTVYLENHTDDLLFIWLSTYREKVKRSL